MREDLMAYETLEMTLRARVYLAILVLRHLSFGLLLILASSTFHTLSFRVILEWVSPQAWGSLFLVIGLVAAVGVYTANKVWARGGLLLSVAITGLWAANFVINCAIYGIDSRVAAPAWAVIWISLLAKDLVMCSLPLVAPLESLL